MLAAKAPLPSINFTTPTPRLSGQRQLCRRHGCYLFFSSITGVNFDSSSSSSSSSSSRNGGVLVRAGGGFTRIPMDAAGAYQVVDNETGEKFIVWGGADDPPDSPLPPKDVLSWKPPRRNSNTGKTTVTATEGIEQVEEVVDKDTPTVKGLPESFRRLKVHKIRALVKKSSPRKQEIDEHDKEPDVVEDRYTSPNNNKFESTERKKKVNSLGHGGNVSRDSKPPELRDRIQEFKDKIQATRTGGDGDESDVIVKNNEDKFSEYQSIADGPRKSDAKTNPRGSAPKFAGWGKGREGSVPESKYKSTDHQKRGRKMSIDSDFFSRKSFRDMGCSEYMIESLKAQSFSRPSHIQAMAFSSVVEGKSCIIADQSGSGKTLAYLAPLIQRLREEELQGISKSSSLSPRVIIIVPTAELASQVLNNCRSLSKSGVPFRSMVVTGGFRQKTQLETLQQGVDVVIATPGRFMYLIKEGFLQLTNIRCAVLDEVDILFNDEDFEVSLQNLISSSPVTTQYLFATATLPVNIYNKLVEVFPDCNVIMGPGMHRTSPRLEEVLVDCSGDGGAEKTPETAFQNKKSALLRIVEERPVSKTIIFCNKIETCRKVENILKRFDKKGTRVKVLPFHAALARDLRLASMKEFTNPRSKEDSLFLVCTDRASRGIDFPDVDHVILFDFPRDPSEYVRRVGRTARGASGRGKAFVLVVGKQVSLAGRIMERNQKGRPLHDVPSAYELFS